MVVIDGDEIGATSVPYGVSAAAVLSVMVGVATPLTLSMPVAPTRRSISAASSNTQSNR